MIAELKRNLARIKAAGASYADARWYPYEDTNQLLMWNGNLKDASAGRQSGVGVRVLFQGAWGFSASSDVGNVAALFDAALDNARVAAERVALPVRLADKDIVHGQFTSPCSTDPFEVPLSDKVAFLRTMDQTLDRPGVSQRVSRVNLVRKHIVLLDTDGSEIDKRITEIFAALEVYGQDDHGVMHERKYKSGRNGLATRGWEIMDAHAFGQHAERIIAELNSVLKAPDCPQDTRSVILLPAIMQLQTHETIGHPLELDRILGYELAYAGGSFVTLDDFGRLRYGSDKLTARADATTPNSPGSFGYDDDGVPAQNTLLIDKGILVGAITGRQMVEEANSRAGRSIFAGSGGCNRASAFFRVPIERMTNINIDPGQDGSLQDIIRTTERGIVLDGDRSWSIGSNREQFHFGTEIGWLVEDGALGSVVKNATYHGDTVAFWNSLSAVGDASTWHLGYVPNCGKGQPNQIMHLGHGVPVCRFDHVEIGEAQ